MYPQLVEDALDSLVKNRESCGIKPNNNFFFANTALNYIRGADTIRDLVDKCNLNYGKFQKPQLIRSTKLRKHVATVAQILVLNGEELGLLLNHLGHSDSVHHGYYRQQESMIEVTHITKMLELVNSGTISKYRGKTLDDITLDDLIIAATHDEPIDEDDDEELDDINSNNIEHDTFTPNVSNDNEVVSEPSSSTSNPSLQVKPKVNLNTTPQCKYQAHPLSLA